MSDSSYWESRQLQNMHRYIQAADRTADQISKLYLKAARYVSLEMDEIFEHYQTRHKLSKEEALRLVNTMQDKASVKELCRKLDEGEGDRKELLAQLEAPAYRARLERLTILQEQMDAIMREIFKQEESLSTAHYIDLACEAYYRGIFDIQQRVRTAFHFAFVDAEKIDRVIHSRWSGKNYSERIWSNTKKLAEELKEELLVNLVTGRTNREAAEVIGARFAQGAGNARRLIWTESAYVAGELNEKAYEEADIAEYRFLATLDLKTSKICREMDGKIFARKERRIGVNFPPMHPWCRSTTIAVISRELLARMKRRPLDPVTHKVTEIPMSMTYQEWYDKFVKGNPEAELSERKIKNLVSDKKQYEKYRERLGDAVPKKLDDFQNMKYNKFEEWENLKETYRDVGWQQKALQNYRSGEPHTVPFNGPQNSVYDQFKEGRLIQRRFYGRTGKPRLDIDLTNHGNPIKHPVVPHRHRWQELQDGNVKRSEIHDMPLKTGDWIANKSILKGIKKDGN